MVTVTSLYICILYIYAYSYNFYDLSSLHAYCMSISFVTCFMSLTYLLSILLLYSCFYTLHILCKYPILSCSFPFMFIYCACIIYFHISYTFIYPILYCPVLLSTFLYFSYTILLYALIWYFSCTILSYVFYLFLVFHLSFL